MNFKFAIKKYGDCRYSTVKTDQGKSVEIVVRDCPSRDIMKNKYDKNNTYPYQIPLDLTEKEDFLNKIKEIEDEFLECIGTPDVGITRHSKMDDNVKIMFCRMPSNVVIRVAPDLVNVVPVKKCPSGVQQVHAIISINKISLTDNKINITVDAIEILFTEKKEEKVVLRLTL